MVRVKICGITSMEDALNACEAGADAIGFVFYERSPRYIDPERARKIVAKLPPFLSVTGVFVDEEVERVKEIAGLVPLDTLQFHGEEPPDYCTLFKERTIKAFGVREGFLEDLQRYRVSAFLLDTYHRDLKGGTGRGFDWREAVKAKVYGRIILAGGLDPDNVEEAVRMVRPFGVDVSTGVEISPGRKDRGKMIDFVRRAKGVVYEGSKEIA